MSTRGRRAELLCAHGFLGVDGIDDVILLTVGQKFGTSHADGAKARFEGDPT